MKLYYVPRSSAARPRWMLEELGVPYELSRPDHTKGETRTPEYKKMHPLGHVPVLVDGDLTMFESAAIVQHLADKYPEKKLAPAPGSPARARYYQWFSFAMTELNPNLFRYLSHTQMLPPEKRVASIAEDAQKAIPDMLAALEQVLSATPFMLGREFTAADLMIGGSLMIANRGNLLSGRPVLENYVKAIMERPAWKRAMAD